LTVGGASSSHSTVIGVSLSVTTITSREPWP
jgi:hypothetical protein